MVAYVSSRQIPKWGKAMNRSLLVMSVSVVLGLGIFVKRTNAQYQPKKRPFDTQSRRPSVSPYMNLVNNSMSGAVDQLSVAGSPSA